MIHQMRSTLKIIMIFKHAHKIISQRKFTSNFHFLSVKLTNENDIELCKLSAVALLKFCTVCSALLLLKSEKSCPCFHSEETTMKNVHISAVACTSNDFLEEVSHSRFVWRLDVKNSNFSRVISLKLVCMYKQT